MACGELQGVHVIEPTRVRLLTVGLLVFTALEAGTGPLVLLIHGFPDGPESYGNQLTALAEAGFHAVAVTLRGYENSSRPSDASYRIVDLATDVIGWMNALGETQAHIVGHDWGATIAFAAAVSVPERVKTLTMIAVPPLRRLATAIRSDPAQRKRSRYMFFFQLKGVADWWLRRRNAALVERLWRKWSPGLHIPLSAIERARARFCHPQVSSAALSYYRQTLDVWSKRGRKSWALMMGCVHVSTLGLCGDQDGCVAAGVFMASMRPEDFPAGLSKHSISGAGHFVHIENPEAVNTLLLQHLRTPSLTET